MMAFLPYLLNDSLYDVARFRRQSSSLYDFGFDDDINPYLLTLPLASGYIRPWRHQTSRKSGVSNIQNNKEGFKVNLDVQQFKPEEISVKVVDDCVVVEGKHEEREDEHGYVSRQFLRRYKLPAEVDPEKLLSKLSSDGILSINAPMKEALPPTKERVIQIVLTNAPVITQGKSHSEEKKSNDKDVSMKTQ